jgi:hypothetical protein
MGCAVPARPVFLRFRKGEQWRAGDPAATVKKIDKPAQQLAQGRSVHIAGYPLSPLLAQGMGAAKLQPPAQQPNGRLVWLELGNQTTLTTAAEKQVAEWQQAGWQVTAQTVTTPAFWQTVDAEAAPELISATLAAINTEPIGQADTASASKE